LATTRPYRYQHRGKVRRDGRFSCSLGTCRSEKIVEVGMQGYTSLMFPLLGPGAYQRPATGFINIYPRSNQGVPMKILALTAISLTTAVAVAARADTPATANNARAAAVQPAKAIKPMELTCREFLSYDEVTRPQIVYWSEGMNRNGKPQDAVIDVERINSLVPVLVDDCRKEPQTSYWKKMKEEFKRVF
jgi:acid stress chaperone HdeA